MKLVRMFSNNSETTKNQACHEEELLEYQSPNLNPVENYS